MALIKKIQLQKDNSEFVIVDHAGSVLPLAAIVGSEVTVTTGSVTSADGIVWLVKNKCFAAKVSGSSTTYYKDWGEFTKNSVTYPASDVYAEKIYKTAFLLNNNLHYISPVVSDGATTPTMTMVGQDNFSNTLTYVDEKLEESKSYTDQKVAALVNGAPETLNTLDELAAALKDNANVVTVLENSIATKQDKISDLATIRANASKGATALQAVPDNYVTEEELSSKGFVTKTTADSTYLGKSAKAVSAATADSATTATTATNLASKPIIAKGSTNTNAITITAGGKKSDEFEVHYATKANTANKATTADSANALGSGAKPVFAAGSSTGTIKVTVGGQTSDDFTVTANRAIADAEGNNIADTYLTNADASNYLTKTEATNTYLTKSAASTTYLGKTAKAANATKADSATKATQDASGNVITETYLTKSDAETTYLGINDKATSAATADNATKATSATTATNLASAATFAAGTTSANAITITVGGKKSSEFTVPYATKAGSATSATSATKDSDGNAINTTYLKVATASSTYVTKIDATNLYAKKSVFTDDGSIAGSKVTIGDNVGLAIEQSSDGNTSYLVITDKSKSRSCKIAFISGDVIGTSVVSNNTLKV